LLFWGWKGLTGGTLVAGLLMCLCYFYAIPSIAQAFAATVPASYEKKLGEAIYAKAVTENVIDKKKTELINEFFRELNYPDSKEIKITVLNEQLINAFAMPGGHIIVYNSLISKTNSYAELAALLAHEYSHIKLRHTTRTLFRNLANYLFVSLMLGDASGSSAVVVENLNAIKTLHYSRYLEKEADLYGLKLMTNSHIELNEMIGLLQELKKYSSSNSKFEIISSHPVLEKRIEYVIKSIDSQSKQNSISYSSKKLESIWQELKK
jgi:beta-barrel assembly-enhancing protease